MKQDLPEYGWRQIAARNRNPIRMASHVVGLSVPAVKSLNSDVRAMMHSQITDEYILGYVRCCFAAGGTTKSMAR